jgi:hypothetical protein
MNTGISHSDNGSDQISRRDDATTYTARSLLIVGFLSVGTVSLTIFIITERKANTPLIDFKLIANRMILACNIVLLISFRSMFTDSFDSLFVAVNLLFYSSSIDIGPIICCHILYSFFSGVCFATHCSYILINSSISFSFSE